MTHLDPPRYLKVIPENIPAEMREFCAFVNWRGEARDGKYTKCPYQPNGWKASSTNRATWRGMDDVSRAYLNPPPPIPPYDGIGICLGGTPYAAVDVDKCVTDGEPNEWGRKVLSLFPGAYKEVSPSGTGIRIVVRGSVPAAVNDRRSGTELYSEGRFVTLTGHALPGSSSVIADGTAGLRKLYDMLRPPKPDRPKPEGAGRGTDLRDDNDILSLAFQAKNGAKIRALYGGDTTGFPSASEAVASLAWCLAFYTGNDPAQLERLMRSSNLNTAKWDESRGAHTWIELEVLAAIEGQSEFYSPPGVSAPGRIRTGPKTAAGGAAPLADAPTPEPAASLVCLADVRPEVVTFLWANRIPRGKLTVIDGDPGLGKSSLTLDIAARVTVGEPMPDESGDAEPPGDVLLCTVEDGLGDTIRPRLEAAGADLSRVHALQGIPLSDGTERLITLPDDAPLIEQIARRLDCRLIVVDPLMAFFGEKTNSFRDQDVRRALTPMARLAEATGAAVVVVRHLNKASGGSALYRGGGSIGIAGAARSVLLVAKHPDNEEIRVLASVKSNLSKLAPSLAFRLTDETGRGVARVRWEGETNHSADSLLAAPVSEEERSALTEAETLLKDLLSGGPVAAMSVHLDAKNAGIADRTLHRAKKRLGILSKRIIRPEGGNNGWEWVLPEGRQNTTTEAPE